MHSSGPVALCPADPRFHQGFHNVGRPVCPWCSLCGLHGFFHIHPCVCVCVCEREREKKKKKEVCIQRDNFIVWETMGGEGRGRRVGEENNTYECHCV